MPESAARGGVRLLSEPIRREDDWGWWEEESNCDTTQFGLTARAGMCVRMLLCEHHGGCRGVALKRPKAAEHAGVSVAPRIKAPRILLWKHSNPTAARTPESLASCVSTHTHTYQHSYFLMWI